MKEMKRVLSLILCFVMLVGLVPAIALNADAAEGTPVDALVVFSDLHIGTNSTDKEALLTGVLTQISDDLGAVTSVNSAGDMYSSNESTMEGTVSTVTGWINSVFSGADVNYVWTDHDRNAEVEKASGLVYEGGYYVYTLSMADLGSWDRYSAGFYTAAEIAEHIDAFEQTAAGLDKTKPLFIVGHQPLFDDRGDNGYAYQWVEAINSVAATMDVAYFYGHNHNYDDSAADYYIARGETMSVPTTNVLSGSGYSTDLESVDVKVNFTHINAGYMDPGTKDSNTRTGTALAVAVYDDEIVYTTYDSNGVYTGDYELSENVARAFAAKSGEADTFASEPASTTAEPDYNEVTVGGTSNETKTVYVRVDSFVNGEEYLLIGEDGPSNGNPIALVNSSGSDTYTAVTVKTDSITVDGTTYTDGYIELDNANAVFTATASGSGFVLKNGSYYIGGTSATTLYNSSSDAVAVTYDASAVRLKTASDTVRYLYYSTYNNETWKWSTTSSSSTSSRAMYIYQKVDIPISSQVTYTMKAEDLEVVVESGVESTAELTYELLGNGQTAVLPTGGSYSFEVLSDDSDIISGIDDGTVAFTGNAGTAKVKVAYTWTQDGTTYTVYKNITVEATAPYYTIELHENANGTLGEEITAPVALKGIKAGDTYSVWAVVKEHTAAGVVDKGELGDALSWTVSDTSIATIDTATGVITFTGKNYGTFTVTVAYEGADGKVVTDTVTISATDSLYIVPGDGTDDFPEYPDEGAVRFDKNATAVGNFSETGIAKVELSMTGVPYTTDNRMDVVLMLDRSSSMYKSGVQHRISSTIAATKAFVKNIVTNEDGSFNNNRILILDFLGGNIDSSQGGGASHAFQSNRYTQEEDGGYEVISSQAELEALYARIDAGFVGQTSLYGTEYAQGLQLCYDALAASRADGNKQFCVFMSDGIPNYMKGETTHFKTTDAIVSTFDVTNRTASSGTATRNSTKYEYEYYSTQMKNEGVTVYTVGLGLKNTNSAWKDTSAEVCEQVANMLLNDIAGPANEKTSDRDTGNAVSKLNKYFFSVTDDEAAENMDDVFGTIAQKIVEAAKNVVVEDKIGEHYTMNFSFPNNGVTEDETGMSQFYIQVLEYQLDANKERTGTAAVLENFTFDANGALVSHSVGGTVTCKGTECTHVTFTNSKVSKIAGTYFTYTQAPAVDADGNYVKNEFGDVVTEEILTWNAEKLTTTELALEYFVYLDRSAGYAAADQVEAGTYPTNEYATITYDNYLGNRVQQEYPIPTMTWMGAQVTYVFYLVNDAGQPVNRAGRVIPFAESIYVTDPVTYDVTWNELTGTENILAQDIYAKAGVPDVYQLYDTSAEYVIRVYQTENVDTNGTNGNYFQISGSSDKLIDSALDSDTTANNSTTVVFNTKAGQKYDQYGYYSVYNTGTTLTDGNGTFTTDYQAKDIDYANTTVAFAVVWKPALIEDTVVVDYGLDVLIDVIKNDNMAAGVVGVRTDAPSNVTENSGTYTAAKANSVDLKINDLKIGTARVENLSQVRFSLDKTNGMQFNDAAKFYYEADVNFYDDKGTLQSTSMYSSVTVIPATTVYYEDSFLTFTGNGTNWADEGTALSGTQAQDRPGASKISESLDADNIYGYDGVNLGMSQFSMGSAKKVHVGAGTYATAEFTFYGTGFDIIGMTSNTTGMLAVKVVDANGTKVDGKIVDTYYGCSYNEETGEWVFEPNTDKAMYQVPVMQAEGLTYGKYTVTVTATYVEMMDHTSAEGYDLYIDAVRIYDPANDGAGNSVIENAYKADGEGWPSYIELRNKLIDPNEDGKIVDGDFGNDVVEGAVFIDGDDAVASGEISKYIAYGPNNEVYLAADQSVAFQLSNVTSNVAKIQIGVKSADGSTGSYSFKNVAADGTVFNAKTFTVNTTTDMYYDLTAWKDGIIVITNTGSGVISITNIKTTYTADPNGTSAASEVGIYMTPAAAELVLNAMKPEPVNPFADVQKSDFYYDAVLWAVENGITNGVTEDRFAPTMYCNRAQVVTFLWRAAGSPEPAATVNPFVDVKESDFYYKAVLWAVENGITNGLTADTFGPNALCNRAQVVTFLWRANGSVVCEGENPFVDVADDSWYENAVVWAVENGITNGASANAFDPNGTCMRAHVVTFLYRAAQLSADSEF